MLSPEATYEAGVPAQEGNHEDQGAASLVGSEGISRLDFLFSHHAVSASVTHLLQLQSIIEAALADLEVSPSQDKRSNRHQTKYASKDHVDLECEEKEGEQREAPHDQVQRDGGVKGGRACPRRVCLGGVGGAELEVRELQDAEGEPEDVEEAHDHHGEEVAHDPFEYQGEGQEDWPGEEEDAPA